MARPANDSGCLTVAALVYLALDRISHSRFGRALMAIAQDEEAARASGISVNIYKSKCFLVAAFTAGVAGGLYAYHSRYLSPDDFTFLKSIDILDHGRDRRAGKSAGSSARVIVVIAPEVLRSSGEMRLILFGLLGHPGLAGTGNRGLAGLTVDLFGVHSRLASPALV